VSTQFQETSNQKFWDDYDYIRNAFNPCGSDYCQKDRGVDEGVARRSDYFLKKGNESMSDEEYIRTHAVPRLTAGKQTLSLTARDPQTTPNGIEGVRDWGAR